MLYFKYFLLFFILAVVASQSVTDYEENINNLYEEYMKCHQPTSYRDYFNDDALYLGLYGIFDFVIVGASAAGSVLARRLTDNPNWNVLLIEAGPSDNYVTDIPALSDLLQCSNYSYGFQSTPQKNSFQGMVNNIANIEQGKGLGGSTIINSNSYIRGSENECNILNQQGLNTWNSSICLQYYKRSEHATVPGHPPQTLLARESESESNETESFYILDPNYHSTTGQLHTEPVKYFDNIGNAMMNAAIELNRNIIDYNGPSQTGYSMLQSNTNNGKRASASSSFLDDIKNRRNLVIVTNAFVTKLTYIPLTRIVNGVNFVLGNYVFSAIATKEVLLSAETIRSTQILMNSGIGPSSILRPLNIPLVRDLPVGQNLINFPIVPLPIQLRKPFVLPSLTKLIENYLNGTGFLTTSRNYQALGSVNTVNASATTPNTRHWFGMPYFGKDYGYNVNYLNYNNKTFNEYFGPVKPSQKIIVLNVMILQTVSRGQITLKSNNPFDFPNIDLNYFNNSADLQLMVDAIKDAFTLLDTKAMNRFGISVPTNPLSACSNYTFKSDPYYSCMAKQIAVTSNYFSGTNKMGLASDSTAVVDQTFKVIGVGNLRVVDESVIPFASTGYPNALQSLFGERAADMIKSDYSDIDLDLF